MVSGQGASKQPVGGGAVVAAMASDGKSGAGFSRSLWGDAWRRLRKNRAAVAGIVFLGVIVLSAIAAPLITPYSPYNPDLAATLEGPSAGHLLGTDEMGRDLVTRLLYGARISLAVAFVVQTLSLVIGAALGSICGYFGGVVDAVIMRVVDIMYSFPQMLFAVFMVAFLSPTVWSIILVLSLVGWPFPARLVRAEVLALREREFVNAARVVGAGNGRIMLRHIFPNTLTPQIINFTIGIAGVIIAEAGLSFLGIGIQAPTPTWGGIIARGRDYFRSYPQLALYPSALLGLTVLAFNFVGDGLRDGLDPRIRK